MKGPGQWGEHPVLVYHEVKALGEIELRKVEGLEQVQAQVFLHRKFRNLRNAQTCPNALFNGIGVFHGGNNL